MPLEELVKAQIAVFADISSEALTVVGPSVDLNSATVEAIGLAIHELGTNALKYGAWSAASGKVAISWRFTDTRRKDGLEVSWQETDGPPVQIPQRSGFGSKILLKIVPGSVGGRSTLEYRDSGLEWRLQFPLVAATTNSNT